MSDYQEMVTAYQGAGGDDIFADSDVAHLVLEQDKVLGSHLVEGLELDVINSEAGKIEVEMIVRDKIVKPVHLCFGVLPEEGLQQIDMKVDIKDEAAVEVLAHCVFPNAIKVKHVMDAEINVGKGGKYIYRESHFHGDNGGVEVVAKTDIDLDDDGLAEITFDLIKGRVGKMDIDYEAEIGDRATVRMFTRLSGSKDDKIKIREAGQLKGEDSKGVLESKIALRDSAQADIINELTAVAAGARGHVDCTEIIKDDAIAKAVPIVDVRHPEAKVTHEAAIGSVDSTQLQTLMARGLNEEEASDVIVQGLLNS